jgi:autotransporter-associated beta strand protein
MPALAATFTWSGGGGNVNWSTGNNWGGTAPSSATTTDLVFAGNTNTGTSLTPLNNGTNNFQFNSINFSSGGGTFFIGGNSLALAKANQTITQSSSSNESIANAIAHTGANSSRLLTLTGTGTGIVTLGGNITNGTGQRVVGITKSGATSTFVLAGTGSDYSDTTSINAGTLIGTSASAFGNSAITLGGGTLGLRNNSATNFGRAVTVSANSGIFSDVATPGAGVNHTLGQLNIGANTLSVGAGSNVTSGVAGLTFGLVQMSGNAVFDVADNTNLSLGALTNNFAFTKQGNGTLTLTTASARNLGSTINGGTVVLSNPGGLGTGSTTINSAVLNLLSNNSSVGGVNLNNGTVTASTGTLNLAGNVVSSGASTISAPIALTATRTFDVTNTLTASGRISGTGFGINKTNSGELVLSGPNTYTGLTDIQSGQVTIKSGGNIAGSIRVAGSATLDTTDFGGTGFSVATGQTLSGSGTVNGKVNIGGTSTKISPGDAGSAPATLATGDEEWAGGGTYVWELKDANGAAGVGYDQLQLSGALSVTASSGTKFNIDITSLTAANANGNAANFVKTENYDWVIATTSGPVSIDPNAFGFVDHFTNDTTSTGVAGAVDGAFSISGSGNDVVLHYSAAPEPGAITLLAIGIGGYLGRRPRRLMR